MTQQLPDLTPFHFLAPSIIKLKPSFFSIYIFGIYIFVVLGFCALYNVLDMTHKHLYCSVLWVEGNQISDIVVTYYGGVGLLFYIILIPVIVLIFQKQNCSIFAPSFSRFYYFHYIICYSEHMCNPNTFKEKLNGHNNIFLIKKEVNLFETRGYLMILHFIQRIIYQKLQFH